MKFAQPSYNGDESDLHFPRIQRWRGNTVVRFSNFVENAAMVIDFNLIMTKLLPIMGRSISGWGIDYCFFHLGEPDIHEIGTIHAVRATHPPSKIVTRASQAYNPDGDISLNKYGGVVGQRDSVNRKEGEELMEFCGAFMYIPKVFFRVKPGENKEDVIQKELSNYPSYKAFNRIKSKW